MVSHVSTDATPLILDAHMTVIHSRSRRHCLRKDWGSLSSAVGGHPQAPLGPPVDSDPDLTSFRSPRLATAFRESSQKGFLLPSGLFWTKLALRRLLVARESC